MVDLSSGLSVGERAQLGDSTGGQWALLDDINQEGLFPSLGHLSPKYMDGFGDLVISCA